MDLTTIALILLVWFVFVLGMLVSAIVEDFEDRS